MIIEDLLFILFIYYIVTLYWVPFDKWDFE